MKDRMSYEHCEIYKHTMATLTIQFMNRPAKGTGQSFPRHVTLLGHPLKFSASKGQSDHYMIIIYPNSEDFSVPKTQHVYMASPRVRMVL